MIPLVEENSTGCRFGDKNGFFDLACKIKSGLSVLVAAPPGISYPVIVLSSRVIINKLLGLGSTGGGVYGGEIGELRFLQSFHNSAECTFEIFRVIRIPTAIELISNSNEEWMRGMILYEVNQFINEMIVGTIGHAVFGVSFHRNGKVHDASIEDWGI